MGTLANPGMLPIAPQQDERARLERRVRLAQALEGAQRPNTPVAAGLDGLARVIASVRGGRAEEQLARLDQDQRASDMAILHGMNGSGNPLAQIAQIRDPRLQQLAAVFANQKPEERRVIADATGRQRYVDSGELVFPDVDTSSLVSPREKLKLEERKAGISEANLDARKNELEFDRTESIRKSENLSAAAEKRLIQFQDGAIEAGRSSVQLETLANDFELMAGEVDAGIEGDAREALKRIAGSEDAVSILRTRYAALRNSQAVKNLPPGVASDRDIQLALEGFLSPSANPETIASFLRGMAKMERFEEAFSRFAANYIDRERRVGGLLDAWDSSDELAALVESESPRLTTGDDDEDVSGKSDEEIMAILNGG